MKKKRNNLISLKNKDSLPIMKMIGHYARIQKQFQLY